MSVDSCGNPYMVGDRVDGRGFFSYTCLGRVVPNQHQGVLLTIHWDMGGIGLFNAEEGARMTIVPNDRTMSEAERDVVENYRAELRSKLAAWRDSRNEHEGHPSE